ncbi:MAG: class I SAM-dependent DNA methyltransferase [Opitutaceae bacterium]
MAKKPPALEEHWAGRFDASAGMNDDAARNIGRTYGHSERRAVFQELVARHLPAPARSVLDVGCGSGTYFDIYERLGLRIQGLDFSEAQLAIAAQRAPGSRLFRGELQEAPVELEADLVVCIGVIQVVTDLAAFAQSLAKRVRPGGIAIISHLEKKSVWPGRLLDPHLRFYTRAHIRRLFAARLREKECRRFYPMPPPFHILRPILYRMQIPLLNHGNMFVFASERT